MLEARQSVPQKGSFPARFKDEAQFLRNWVEKPLLTGSVIPSSKALARVMASFVDPRRQGQVIELGPGTGPVTEALLQRGIEQERLVLVEFNPDFCRLLKRRFPKACIVQGDAYDIAGTLKGILDQPAAATVSSLPLFTKPPELRLKLMREAHNLMISAAPFVQFTYAVVPPIPKEGDQYSSEASERVWLNFPPARVWAYRQMV